MDAPSPPGSAASTRFGPGDLLGRGREGAVDRADLAGVDRRLAVEAELACALAAARQAVGIIQAHVRRVDGVDARGAAGQHDLALRGAGH